MVNQSNSSVSIFSKKCFIPPLYYKSLFHKLIFFIFEQSLKMIICVLHKLIIYTYLLLMHLHGLLNNREIQGPLNCILQFATYVPMICMHNLLGFLAEFTLLKKITYVALNN